LQVQNYPRETFPEEEMLQILKTGVPDLVTKYGDVMGAVSKCLRSMLTGAPEHGLIGCDFSSIEARVLAWFAGEEWKLKAFREGKDMYKVAYSRLFNVPLETVTKDERQIGKVAELACGYQGWVNAFGAMAKGYGLVLEEDKTKDVITKWRDNHPNVVSLWHGVEQAAITAIKTGQVTQFRKVVFGMTGRWLYISLPSGGTLYYCDPTVVTKEDKYKRVKETIRFKGEVNGQWIREHTYGGSLVENIVQKFSRDLLADAMLRLNMAGFRIALHCHDEAISEVLAGHCSQQSLELKSRIMSEVPVWAQGVPLNAEGWYGFRFRK
jgi:DNA polymerase